MHLASFNSERYFLTNVFVVGIDLSSAYTDIKFEMEEPDEIEDKYHLYQEPSWGSKYRID